ncbi:MAG TPA: IS1634 family transposase [Arachnia sp.]|nr:IS1634 family transposase [Arachnia sp.]
MVLPRIRVVPTGSGARAVQVIWHYRDNKPVLDHIGSAHTDEELALLNARAQRLIDDQQPRLAIDTNNGELMTGSVEAPLAIAGERAGYLIDAIGAVYRGLGFDIATDGDEVFEHLVIARIVQPGSKLDSIETLAEIGIRSASYPTIKRRLPIYAKPEFQDRLTRACVVKAGIGPGVLIMYDVTTLYFETDTADELRVPGYSKERRLEPQITVGLLADATGFPLAVAAFEGNKAEKLTMIPMIEQLQRTYDLTQVTVVADSGMFSTANKKSIVDAGLGYILGTRIAQVPYPILRWRKLHPETDYVDGQIWTFKDRTGRGPEGVPHSITYYQYSADRARRSRKGIAEQVRKAEDAVAGKTAVKRNRYVDLHRPTKTVNYELAEKNTALAGIKGYETNLIDLDADQVIGAYRQLLRIEKAFRMSKSDLKARPIYHHTKDSIQAHLTIVMAAMAVGHELEHRSGLSLRRLVRTLKRYRTFELNINGHTIHAATPLPTDIRGLVRRLAKT